MLPQVPHLRLGTAFQLPSWRYEAAANPAKFGLGAYCSKIGNNSGCLLRLVGKGSITPALIFNLPPFFQELESSLSAAQSAMLLKVWAKQHFRQQPRKATFSSQASHRALVSWNITKVMELQDNGMRELLLHVTGVKTSQPIAAALTFYLSPSNSELVRHINYACYYGMSSTEMAKRWKLPLKTIDALKSLFFDYSHFPVDRYVRFSLIRQMVAEKVLDDADFHRFRRIFDLGKAGLESLLGYDQLSDKDKAEVRRYLSSSVIDNTLDLRYTISNAKEAHDYGRMINNTVITETNLRMLQAQTIGIEANNARLQKELAEASASSKTEDDNTLYGLLLKQHSLFNATPVYPSIHDIRNNVIDVTVEK
ncbi:MAG: hypothetical protein EBU46_00920 [Nitrosomonadaceae bacterium]|nr:hypothetical protein [Nitrosomonadaceae bacterium]